MQTPAPPSTYNSACPNPFNDLLARLLAKEPSGRPDSAEVVSAELQAIEDNNERFLETMRVIQGSIIVVGILQMGKFLFCTGQYTRSRCVCMCTMLLVESLWIDV